MFTYFIDGVRTAIAVCRCFRGTPWCANWFYKRWNSTEFQRSSGRNFKLNTSTSRLTETAHSFRAPTVHKIVIGASLTSSSSLLQITLLFCFSINLSKASLCEVKSTRDSGQEIWNSQRTGSFHCRKVSKLFHCTTNCCKVEWKSMGTKWTCWKVLAICCMQMILLDVLKVKHCICHFER